MPEKRGHPPLIVASRAEAEAMLADEAGAAVAGIISIGGSHEPPCRGLPGHATVLRLIFDDVPVPEPAPPTRAGGLLNPMSWLDRLSPPLARETIAPGPAHVGQVVAFAQAMQDARDPILCHCHAGISRSSAAALMCLAVWLGAGQEREAVSRLFDVRPMARPHGDLVRMADTHLDREGRLFAEVSRWLARAVGLPELEDMV